MSIIDFHSHILPKIDDGSKDIDTTVAMLGMCEGKGVDIMVATPHFYAEKDRIDKFLERRQRAYEQVMALDVKRPEIRLGAEVAYFPGISKADRIEELTIEGTRAMLLEMPFETWSSPVVCEVERLINDRNLHIILAHIERFLKFPGNKPFVDEVLKLPVSVQVNAAPLTDTLRRGKLLKLFDRGQAHLLGSDCHGLSHRPPNVWEGRSIIEKKLGKSALDRIDEHGAKLLGL